MHALFMYALFVSLFMLHLFIYCTQTFFMSAGGNVLLHQSSWASTPFRGGLLKPSSSQSCLEARAKQSRFSWTFSYLYIISHRRLQTRKDLIHITPLLTLISTIYWAPSRKSMCFLNTMMNQADTGPAVIVWGQEGLIGREMFWEGDI